MAPLDASGFAPSVAIEQFINRWQDASGAERANYQMFLTELCGVLNVALPDPAVGGVGGTYRFERAVWRGLPDGKAGRGRIDLYRRDAFIVEAKQGASPPRQATLFGNEDQHRSKVRRTEGWAQGMLDAKGQAEQYARGLAQEKEAPPPFLIVCDVGFCFDLYADFSRTGLHYAQFPDREGFRIYLTDLRNPDARSLLRRVWDDAASLDPALLRQRVTQDIARLLAKLARALEGPRDKPHHAPEQVSTFLMRCIFCMFAQSVGLLPQTDTFTTLLIECHRDPASFVGMVGELWGKMNSGGFSAAIRAIVLRFNGGLFAPTATDPGLPLPLDADSIWLLIQAAKKDWADVEPAIFGTLLEQALDNRTRGQLGAEFTPRAFVERLVLPTVMEPLRTDWDGAKAAARAHAEAGRLPDAAAEVRAFHARLCGTMVLDPACGTGNFLYVTLELMKRLEGEVLDALALYVPEAERLDMRGVTVDPHQFHGLDLNPRAVPVAELVLWIGYLQWHFRTRGRVLPTEPILRDFHNIQHTDALLAYTDAQPMRDKHGDAVTRWGGRTTLHPITGEAVPDETDRVLVVRPVNPKPTAWPQADFIVGNPPFVAGKDMRAELGSGYAEALWKTYPTVPASADLALHFWWKAAQATTHGPVRRFGFITSNSLRQAFCRRVVADALVPPKPLHLAFAIPDHPWSQGRGAAAVRIAMTVAEAGKGDGRLLMLTREDAAEVPNTEFAEQAGTINADLTIGASPAEAKPLRANDKLCSPGVKLHGPGFIVSPAVAHGLGLGKVPGLDVHIRPYLNGRDMTGRSRGQMVIDLYGLTEAQARQRFPAVFGHMLLHVKPERDAKRGGGPDAEQYARDWWLFGKPRPELRRALDGLPRYIATVETAKHRVFVFQPKAVLPDNMLVCIASADAFHLGVLCSRIHTAWAPAAGGWLGFGNDPRYNKTRCFDPFPFPAATLAQQAEIRALAEELDALRRDRLTAHSFLTLTGLYNVLNALRVGRTLDAAERDVMEIGHVPVLRHLHDRLDAVVAAAYGWAADLPAAELVARLVALNRERLVDEARNEVRWLRPEFQAPTEMRRRATQPAMDVQQAVSLHTWPDKAPAQYIALRAALSRGGPSRPIDLARGFQGAPRSGRLKDMLETLVALGQARPVEAGRYIA